MKSMFWTFTIIAIFSVVHHTPVASEFDVEPFDVQLRLAQFDINGGGRTLSQNVQNEYQHIMLELGMRGSCESSYSTAQLKSAWYAALWAGFYTTEVKYLNDQLECYESISAKGALISYEIENTFTALLRYRRFEQADEMRERHPSHEFPSLPKFTDFQSEGPSIIRIIEQPEVAFERHAVHLPDSRAIVVISAAGCQFSRRAIQAIQADPYLRQAFSGSLWMTPPDDLTQYHRIIDWNEKYSDIAELTVVYAPQEFPLFDMQQSPTFYFLNDGEIVETMIGWDDSIQPALVESVLKRWQEN